jgi:hypothetical protein
MFENPPSLDHSEKKLPTLSESKKETSIRAHEEETSTIGSVEFFNATLSEDLEDCASVEDAHQRTIGTIEMIESDLGERAKGLSQSIKNFKIDKIFSVDEYINLVSPILSQSIGERFSLEELEEIERNEILSHKLNTGVNEVVYYQLDPNKKYITVNIHNAKSISFREIMEGFINGLKEMAQQLKADPELFSIEEIKARSWIIEKHPKIAERYGFSLNGTDSASITRENFIKKYGG